MVKCTAAALEQSVRAVEALVDRSAVSDRELLRRFGQENDQAAFAVLVRRYTGMVFGACRRALPNVQDAEDACQATFLVLAKKASAGQWRPSVANWLYTTARRVAANARRSAQRRARREETTTASHPMEPIDQLTGRELLAALDEELDKLPPRYREPLILCCLEGLSRDEAAARLGVPTGTVKTQLERGRKKLGDALARRGCALGVGLLALAATARGAPPALAAEALKASGVRPAVASLAQEALRTGSVRHALAASVLVVTLLGATIAAQFPRTADRDKVAPAHAAPVARVAPPKRAERTVTGVVLGPDGKAVKGTRVFLLPRHGSKEVAHAEVSADGAFRLRVVPDELSGGQDEEGWRDGRLIATAPGLGPAWARLGDVIEAGWKARLVPDQIIEGKLTNLEGRPIVGARITLGSLQDWSLARQLDEYIEALWKGGRRPAAPSSWWGAVPRSPEWKTDDQGRYRITGLGRDRIAHLHVSGGGAAWTTLSVVTRPGGKMITGRGGRFEGPVVLLPAKHQFSLAPGRTVRGVVKDEGGKPVAGMRISLEGHGQSVVTGPDGGFAFEGAPKKARYTLHAFPTEKAASFINAEFALAAKAPGLGEERIELKVRRGVPLRVKVVEKGTKKPQVGTVYCQPVFPNERVPDNLSSHFLQLFRQPDGSYVGAALPGPGAITVRRSDRRYVPATANQKAFFKLDRMPNKEYGASEGDLWLAAGRNNVPIPLPMGQFHAVRFINPAKETKELSLTVELDPGQTKVLRFTDERGAVVKGARWKEEVDAAWSGPLPEGKLEVAGVGPAWPRYRFVRHPERKLAALVKVTADSPSPRTIVLRPWATLTGRLLDKDGKPMPYHRLGGLAEWVRTDPTGRFRAEGLPAEVEHTIRVDDGDILRGQLGPIKLRPGEVKDLGEVRVRPLRR